MFFWGVCSCCLWCACQQCLACFLPMQLWLKEHHLAKRCGLISFCLQPLPKGCFKPLLPKGCPKQLLPKGCVKQPLPKGPVAMERAAKRLRGWELEVEKTKERPLPKGPDENPSNLAPCNCSSRSGPWSHPRWCSI
jgi:hypothetical protein